MDFNYFIKDGKVIVGEKDLSKAKALVTMSNNNFTTVKMLKLNPVTASSVLSLSYEFLRELLESICLLEGYKVYSHEAFVFYLKQIGEERISELFDRFRRLRNGINYYGKSVSIEIALDAREQIEKLCAELKRKYLK